MDTFFNVTFPLLFDQVEELSALTPIMPLFDTDTSSGEAHAGFGLDF